MDCVVCPFVPETPMASPEKLASAREADQIPSINLSCRSSVSMLGKHHVHFINVDTFWAYRLSTYFQCLLDR